MKKSDTMLTLARVTELISLMPNKLLLKDISEKECRIIWDFLNSHSRLAISSHMLKINFAKELGVFADDIDAVTEGKPLCEVLTWESDEQKTIITLKEAVAVMRNAANSENWILPFCHSLGVKEAELIWRWALDYRWSSIRNRMLKWLKKQSGLQQGSFEEYMNVIFYNVSPTKIVESSNAKLQSWDSTITPSKWWFITDCSKMFHVCKGIARNRNGTLNAKHMPLLNGDEECWVWENPLGTGMWHSEDIELSFSNYKEPITHEWHESQMLLQSYAKGGFLITDENNYYLLTNGTNTLYAQLLNVRNIGKGGYEFVIGFSDGGEIVDATTLLMDKIPYELEETLARRGIKANFRHAFHNIEDCLVVKLNHTWSPTDGWHLCFVDTESEMGIDDIDDITDYYAIVGDDDEEGMRDL
jgi:hypothetical protein